MITSMSDSKFQIFIFIKTFFSILNKKEKISIFSWLGSQVVLVFLDFIALVLVGLVTSSFIPIIQSHPDRVPQIVQNLYKPFDSAISFYEFLFVLFGISSTLLILRSSLSVVIESWNYVHLTNITSRLSQRIVSEHFKAPIEKRFVNGEFRLYQIVHESINSLTIYAVGNLVTVGAEVISITLLLCGLVIWKPMITLIIVTFVLTAILMSFTYHVKKSKKLMSKYALLNQTSGEEFLNFQKLAEDYKLRNLFEVKLADYMNIRNRLSHSIVDRQIQFGFPRLILEVSIIVGGFFTGLVVWYFLNISEGLIVLATYSIVGLRIQPSILKIQNGVQIFLQHKAIARDSLDLILKNQNSDLSVTFTAQGREEQKPNLVISDVSYRFVDGYEIISKLNVTLPTPGIYIVTGVNGAGKTTLLELLAGIRRPAEGTIFFKDIDICNLDEESRSKMVAYTPQKPIFVNQTMHDSFLLENSDSEGTSNEFERIIQILKVLNFDTNKYDFDIKYDLDSYLSEGEKQKIGLARTLSRKADLILLDEPTSALDARTKVKLENLLKDLSLHKIIIIVSHDNFLVESCNFQVDLTKR